VELIENYPGFAAGVPGARLAAEMVEQATKYGVRLENAEVSAVELYSNCKWVMCADGSGYTARSVIIAGGGCQKSLGVPGEEEFTGRGVFNCAFCDGTQFAGQVVAVCGGGDAGVSEAIYMARLTERVVLIEEMPALTAGAILKERALNTPGLEVCCGTRVMAILGDGQVRAIETMAGDGRKETLEVGGVLVHIGLKPNTEYLEDVVSLDSEGRILVNAGMETYVPGIFAAGDIRSGSPCQVITAVGDGASAAISAERYLQGLDTG
jgi:thioredoxin reductase (NADPH)